jgi:hypothetical protein
VHAAPGLSGYVLMQDQTPPQGNNIILWFLGKDLRLICEHSYLWMTMLPEAIVIGCVSMSSEEPKLLS